MKPKIITFVLAFLMTTLSYAQTDLNEYKYVIVPKEFSFLKSADQYQLNSLTKFLFEKEHFQAVFSNSVKPQDLVLNPCLGLTANVKNSSNMFTTKLIVELINCQNGIVFASEEGKSKEKDYKKGYHEALRNTFQSIAALEYNYTPSDNVGIVAVKKEEVPTITEEVKAPVKVEAVTHKTNETIIEVKEETKNQAIEVVEETTTASNLLYAQANSLGFQLVDSTPKVVFILLKSTKSNMYFLKDKNGIVYKENEKWYAEFYNEDKLVKQELQIKF